MESRTIPNTDGVNIEPGYWGPQEPKINNVILILISITWLNLGPGCPASIVYCSEDGHNGARNMLSE